jgi:hypothetical protein
MHAVSLPQEREMLAICEDVPMNFNSDKQDELIVYMARNSRDDDGFDETKLCLLLAFADFLAFGRHGEPITGACYVKLPYGPAPQDAMVALPERSTDVPGMLSTREIAIADEVVARYRGWTSSALSDEAKREFAGWRMVADGEQIPYGTVFLAADQVPSPEAIELGQRYARELGFVAP